ncbi:aspartate/tyrosine/aromatic aminotransferase [Suttonella sp. R2A3]|uniref:amino acid aminotransferase n=1 Tax=Suttonella sp. R2A3 TaxID=2908648 RepID=UPI001F41BA1D|nr:amino acid aminotransferase [Suttonella sp. R2A3]UJF23909.1 aspartate/tyrosine/aromatic aminotransferase [Suttonella sp. R2A3]
MHFNAIEALPDDPILNLSRQFREDPRENKIDVGVGVYQNTSGETPVMRAVKAAEERLYQQQSSKKYLGLTGNEAFNQAMTRLVLGNDFDPSRVRANQSIAGTGALRLIAELLASLKPDATVWAPVPTWGNHIPIFRAAGLPVKPYPYYDTERCALDRDGFFAAMRELGENDVVILHGCCHNPSGEDLSEQDWQTLADIAAERGFLPVIDVAYLGFGKGLDADAYGLRLLAERLESVFIGVSCSKNFGLYRDRAGVALSVGANAQTADALQSHISALSRAMISMPADHGAAVVATILDNPELSQQWRDELDEMNRNIQRRRQELSAALNAYGSRDWSFIERQQGMFSLLPLGEKRVVELREQHGIYMVGAGRINLAGLRSIEASETLAAAIHR